MSLALQILLSASRIHGIEVVKKQRAQTYAIVLKEKKVYTKSYRKSGMGNRQILPVDRYLFGLAEQKPKQVWENLIWSDL